MSTLDAKVSALINAADAPTADSAPDKGAGAPPSGSASGAESAAGALESVAGGSPAAPGALAAPTMADLFAEKLAKTREARQAQRREHLARDKYGVAQKLAAEAETDRKAAAEERTRWENLKSGNILETIKAAGRDPAEVFAAMQREAIESGTPEFQIKRMREEMDRQLAETVEPLKRTIAELTEREKTAQAEAAEASFSNDFARTAEDPAYEELRVEYDDSTLLAHAKRFRDNTQFFHDVVKEYRVGLTRTDGSFTMKDILNVLKSVQDAHVAGSAKRRAAKAPSNAAPQQAASPTVNGTAERRNAEATTIGNDLTTARAADGKFVPKGSTAAQRLRERTRRIGGD